MTITTEMPVGVSHGKVVGRFILAVGDSTGDPDNLPDAQPASGSVVFTALVPNFKTGFPEPAIVVRTPIRCTLDANGRILDPAGSLGVWLIAGTYRVSYSLVGATVDNHTIEVLPIHTNSAPLDLVNALPPGGPILTESQYAELSGRINAIDTSGSVASVNGEIGVVVLDAADVGALTQEQADSLYAPAGSGGAVDSVNGETGVVVLDATDVGALTQAQADSLYAPMGTVENGVVASVNGETGTVIVERFRGAWATDTLVYTQNFADGTALPTGFTGTQVGNATIAPTIGSSAGPTGIAPAPTATRMVCNTTAPTNYSRLTLDVAALNIQNVTRIKYWHGVIGTNRPSNVAAKTLINGSTVFSQGDVMSWTQREHLIDADDVVAWQSQGLTSAFSAATTLFVTGIEIYASAEPYMRGDTVIHANKLWQSTVDNNGATPGGAGWTDLGSLGTVDSVNSKTGEVTLGAADVGALTQTQANALYAPIGSGGAVDSVNGETGAVTVERFRGAWAADTVVYTQNFAGGIYPSGYTGFMGTYTSGNALEPVVGSSSGPAGVAPASTAMRMVCTSTINTAYSRLTLNIATLNIPNVTRIKYWHGVAGTERTQSMAANTLVNGSSVLKNVDLMTWTQREHQVDSNDIVAWQEQGDVDGFSFPANATLFITGIEIYALAEPYMRGDTVVHANKLWQSTVDNNGTTPGGAGWVDLGPLTPTSTPIVTALPPASAALRGQFRILETANVDDGLRVCIRFANGTYVWRTVPLTA